MQGRRVPVDDELGVVGMEPGDYGFWNAGGHWIAVSPNGEMANLSAHQITEHEDDTITVSPSIGIRRGGPDFTYHGYLERGVWRSC